MLNALIALLVTVWLGYMLLKKRYAPGILLCAGLMLIIYSVIVGSGQLINPKFSTGFVPFDIFEAVRRMFTTRTGGLGLQIMMIAGYATYMDKINASSALVNIFAAPLKKLHSPWLIFSLAFLLGQVLGMIVPSGSGAALICMITFYPILVRAGLSRATALIAVCSSRMFGLGPASPNANFAAELVKMDVTEYFIVYQLPVVLFTIGFVIITNIIVQRYFDKKEGPDLLSLSEKN